MLNHSVMSNSFDPMDCSPQGSSVHGIIQARIQEWVAISCSKEHTYEKRINLSEWSFTKRFLRPLICHPNQWGELPQTYPDEQANTCLILPQYDYNL